MRMHILVERFEIREQAFEIFQNPICGIIVRGAHDLVLRYAIAVSFATSTGDRKPAAPPAGIEIMTRACPRHNVRSFPRPEMSFSRTEPAEPPASSVVGASRTCQHVRSMSALGGQADLMCSV